MQTSASYTVSCEHNGLVTDALATSSPRDELPERFLDKIFFQKDGACFTYWEPGHYPIEVNGLELSGSHGSPPMEADKLNGIDAKIHYSFQVKAHRKFERGTGRTNR